MATRDTASDTAAPTTDQPDDAEDTRVIPLQPRHGPQPKRFP